MLVVLIEDQSSFSVASGWKHDALGFVVFFFIGAMVLSTDRLIRAFIPVKVSEQDQDREQDSDDATSAAVSVPNTRLAWGIPESVDVSLQRVLPAILAFALVGLLGVRLYTLSPPVITLAGSLASVSRSALPDTIGDWTVKNFREVTRSSGDLQGEHSAIWELVSGERTIQVSVDGDWTDYHDLGECYSGMGWIVKREYEYPSLKQIVDGIGDREFLDCTRLRLSRMSGEQAIGFFSVIDSRGQVVLPQTYVGNETALYVQEKMLNQLREVVGLPRSALLRETTFVPPCSTIQMMYFAKEPIDESAEASLQQLFGSVREKLKQSKRFGGVL